MTKSQLPFDITAIGFFAEIEVDNNIVVLGGCTNSNYLITCGTKQYVLRIPGAKTETLINRNHSQAIALAAVERGFNCPILFQDELGYQVSSYIPHSVVTDDCFKNTDFLISVASQIKKLHSEQLFESSVNVFIRNARIYRILSSTPTEKNYFLDQKLSSLWTLHQQLASLFQKLPKNICPCHNDITNGNLLNTQKKLFLIDWEYAGNNEAMWDLANLSVQSNFTAASDCLLLNTYDANLSRSEKHKFYLFKFVVEIWRALWAQLQLHNNNQALPKTFYNDQYEFCITNATRISETSEFQGALAWANDCKVHVWPAFATLDGAPLSYQRN